MRERYELLDVIRALAIFLVIGYHVGVHFDPSQLDPLGQWFARFGFLGVDIFFPLSGFLITLYLVQRNTWPDLKVFFTRRVFRIIPIYFLAIALYFTAAELTQTDPGVERAWITALFLTGWMILIDGKDAVPFTITWSLSVEEFAYILCGFAFLWIKRNITWALLFIAAISLAVKVVLLSQGTAPNLVYSYPPARLDSVIIGALTAIAVRRAQSTTALVLLALTTALCVGIANVWPSLFHVVLYPGIAATTSFAICAIYLYLPDFKSRPTRILASFGRLAYFLYLFHYFTLFGLDVLFNAAGLPLQPYFLMVLTLALTWVAAALSWRWIEAPLIAYGRTLEPSLRRAKAEHTHV